MPLFSKKNKVGPPPLERERSNSLFEVLERRQKIVSQREGNTIAPIMEVFNPFLEFKTMPKADLLKYEETFESFDADGDGLLTLEEIKTAMRKLGTTMTHMELKELIREIDADEDDTVDLREFISMYQKLKTGTGSDNLDKMVNEIEVAKIGVGGAKTFFEDKAARCIESSFETELRLEKEAVATKYKEEETRRDEFRNSKAAAFGDVKVTKKKHPGLEKKMSKLKIKKIKSRDRMQASHKVVSQISESNSTSP